MRIKTILFGLLLLLTILVTFLGTNSQYIQFLSGDPWAGPCDPSTEQIELDTRLKGGLGVGYTPIDMHCSVYCLKVPEGGELTIGITDLDVKLNFRVSQELYPYWYPLTSSRQGSLNSRKVITNPYPGRYYIYVCPGEGFGEFWSYEGRCTPTTFTGSTLFTLYNEFTP
jgi:hypothetical protein